MADKNLKDFLLDFYLKYHVSEMPEPYQARYYNLRGKDEEALTQADGKLRFTKDKRVGAHQKWADPKTGKLWAKDDWETVLDELRKPENDSEWENFYIIVRDTLRSIDADKKELGRNLPEGESLQHTIFFGTKPYHAFSDKILEISDVALNDFASVIKDEKNHAVINNILNNNSYNNPFNAEYSLDKFLTDIYSKNYDGKFQEKLGKFLSLLSSNLNSETISDPTLKSAYTKLSKDLSDKKLNLFEMSSALLKEEPIDPRKLQLFKSKQSGIAVDLLKRLYDIKKDDKKSGLASQFASYGGGELVGYMTEAVTGNNDYISGKNLLVPKYPDELSFIEKQTEKFSDWRKDHFARFKSRAAAHDYIEPLAKGCVDAILSVELKPTDGLTKILEKKDAVKKSIQANNPKSADGWDFFVKTIEEIQVNKGMSKAVSGALRNGRKAEAVAMEIIKKSMITGEIGKAKIALEILSVMRMDKFDSVHYAEFTKEKIDLFKGTSFMNHAATKFILNSATGAFNFVLRGMYQGGVLARNKWQHGRTKINDKIENLKSEFRLKEFWQKLEEKTSEFTTKEQVIQKRSELEKEIEGLKTNNKPKEISDIETMQNQIDDLSREINILEEELRVMNADVSEKNRISEIGNIIRPKNNTKYNGKSDEEQEQFLISDLTEEQQEDYQDNYSEEEKQEYLKLVKAKKASEMDVNSVYEFFGDDVLDSELNRLKRRQLIRNGKLEDFDIGKIKSNVQNKTKQLLHKQDQLNLLNKQMTPEKQEQLKQYNSKLFEKEAEKLQLDAKFDFFENVDKKKKNSAIDGVNTENSRSKIQDLQALVMFWNSVNGQYSQLKVNHSFGLGSMNDIRAKSKLPNNFIEFINQQQRAAA